MQEMFPKYLFHYTNIDSLEKILCNRTIRLNPLTGMDDQEEKIAAGGTELGKLMFVSSWTEIEQEVPRMWNEYCRPSPEDGVRIRLKSLPFSKSENHLSSEIDAGKDLMQKLTPFFQEKGFNVQEASVLDLLKCYSDIELAKECVEYGKPYYREYIIHKPNQIDDRLLCKVLYTDAAEQRFPMTHWLIHGRVANDFSNYGIYKNSAWAWQKEWRYRIMTHRSVPGVVHADRSIEMYDTENYIDLVIDKVAFSSMKITMSPVLSEANKSRLNEIVRKYNPFASITSSSLNPDCLNLKS